MHGKNTFQAPSEDADAREEQDNAGGIHSHNHRDPCPETHNPRLARWMFQVYRTAVPQNSDCKQLYSDEA